MTRLLVSGGGFSNKGAEAMLLTVRSQLARRLGECEFLLWRLHPSDTEAALDAGFTPIAPAAISPRWKWVPRGPMVMKSIAATRAIKDIEDFDGLIDISGFAYGDAWGLEPYGRISPVVRYCVRRARPAAFLPQAWGPFANEEGARRVRGLLGGASCRFYSRDELSSRHLESALRLPPGTLPVYPDVAFLFDKGDQALGAHVLETMGCSGSRPIICIAPSARVHRLARDQDLAETYLRALTSLARHCVDGLDADVVLQANQVSKRRPENDDRHVCSLVAERVDRPGRCFMTRDELSAEASRALLGRTRFLVSSRFHSLVFALSQGVPCLSVSWSHKYGELLRATADGEYNLEIDKLTAGDLLQMFDRAWSDRDRLKQTIRERVQEYRSTLTTLFDDVAADIERAARA